jgi:hypothetical protein
MLCSSIALEHSVLQITFLTDIVSHSSTANSKSMQAHSISLLVLYLTTLVVTNKGTGCRMLITCGCIICVLIWLQFQWYTNFEENSEERAIWGSWVTIALLLRVQIFWEVSVSLAEQFWTF